MILNINSFLIKTLSEFRILKGLVNYFGLKYTSIGTPVKSNCLRNWFSMNLLYGSFTYCGRITEKRKLRNWSWQLGNIFYFHIFPLIAGGGVCSIIGNKISLSLEV